MSHQEECMACGASGWETCSNCGGTGTILPPPSAFNECFGDPSIVPVVRVGDKSNAKRVKGNGSSSFAINLKFLNPVQSISPNDDFRHLHLASTEGVVIRSHTQVIPVHLALGTRLSGPSSPGEREPLIALPVKISKN